MGGSVSKARKLLKCCNKKSTNQMEHRQCYSRKTPCGNVQINGSIVRLEDAFVDGALVEFLIQNHIRNQSNALSALIFFNCSVSLHNNNHSVAALAQLFGSVMSLKKFEFWDGELPISRTSACGLFHVLTVASCTTLQRLKLDNVDLTVLTGPPSATERTTFGAEVKTGGCGGCGSESSLSALLRACQQLVHVELSGCGLDHETMHHLSVGLKGHTSLHQLVLNGCGSGSGPVPLDNLGLALLLSGLVSCQQLQHLHLTDSLSWLTPSSLGALTLFLRDAPTSFQELYLPGNPQLFRDCEEHQVRPFFEQLSLLPSCSTALSHQSRDSVIGGPALYLCDTGMNDTAVKCLFEVLFEREQQQQHARGTLNATVMTTEVDLRGRSNCFGAQASWLSILAKLKHLRTLHLPDTVDFANPCFVQCLNQNTSLLLCPAPAKAHTAFLFAPLQNERPPPVSNMGSNNDEDRSWSIRPCQLPSVLVNGTPPAHPYACDGYSRNRMPIILNRNKLLRFVQDYLRIIMAPLGGAKQEERGKQQETSLQPPTLGLWLHVLERIDSACARQSMPSLTAMFALVQGTVAHIGAS